MASDFVEVGQGEESVEWGGVFLKSSVAHFAVMKEVLNDVEGMLYDVSGAGFEGFPSEFKRFNPDYAVEKVKGGG